jgi:hypothetical protein
MQCGSATTALFILLAASHAANYLFINLYYSLKRYEGGNPILQKSTQIDASFLS